MCGVFCGRKYGFVCLTMQFVSLPLPCYAEHRSAVAVQLVACRCLANAVPDRACPCLSLPLRCPSGPYRTSPLPDCSVQNCAIANHCRSMSCVAVANHRPSTLCHCCAKPVLSLLRLCLSMRLLASPVLFISARRSALAQLFLSLPTRSLAWPCNAVTSRCFVPP